MPSPEGELVYSDTYKAYVWRTPEGAETLVPDAVGEAATAAKTNLAVVGEARSKTENTLRTLLGTEMLPETLDEQLVALRTKFLPPEAAALDQALLDPAEARRLMRTVRAADAEQHAGYVGRVTAQIGRAH